jgi:hypothetical protein
MYETKHAVLPNENRTATSTMLLKSRPHIVGDANVQRSIPATGENVDVVCTADGRGPALSRKKSSLRGYGPGLRRDDVEEASAEKQRMICPPLEQIKNTLASI